MSWTCGMNGRGTIDEGSECAQNGRWKKKTDTEMACVGIFVGIGSGEIQGVETGGKWDQ